MSVDQLEEAKEANQTENTARSEQAKLGLAASRLSEKSFVLFIQYPPDEGLLLLDWRQF